MYKRQVLDGETIPEDGEYEIFDPNAVWKRKKITNFYAKNLRQQIFKEGKCIYKSPSINEIKDYCRQQLDAMWDEMKRFENPQNYYVDLSYDPVSYTHLDVYKRQLRFKTKSDGQESCRRSLSTF